MILFVSPRRGRPLGYIAVTDLVEFSICPSMFIARKIFGVFPTKGLIEGQKAHRRMYEEHRKQAVEMPLEEAIRAAESGEVLVGREVEVCGKGLYGIADRVEIKGGEIKVTEYKSGPGAYGEIQVTAYASALSDYGLKTYAEVVSWKDGKVLWEKEITREDVKVVEKMRREFIKAVERGIFVGKDCSVCELGKRCLKNIVLKL